VTRIRFATQDDLDDLSDKDHIPRHDLAAIVALNRILVAEDGSGERFIGWLRWNLFWDEVPFMNLLYVEEPRRGEGVGQLLVGEWE
jgi:hypothetical protein